jgi:hypothetical protein
VTKSEKVRWAGHAACMKEVRNNYIILARKLEGRDQPGDLVHENIILEWI